MRAALLAPAALIRPLSEYESPLKGMSPATERQLLAALEAAPLAERILKVAAANEAGTSVALVKVQLGDAHSRLISVAEVEEDAARAFRVAFGLPLGLRHVDFWACVPEVDGEGVEWHRTVFSVSAERGLYERLTAAPRSTRELLGSLSAVRYDPQFTSCAPDWEQVRPTMPRTAYVLPRMQEQWSELVAEGRMATQNLNPADTMIHAILGGAPSSRTVAVTIDDGPHPLITPLFLDILRREGVRATFFVVGDKAEEYPGLIREIAREGHELGNHTYSHQRFSTLNPEEIWAQVRACSKIVSTLTGQVMRFVRPPGGDYDETALQVLESLGLTTALWTHNAGDWLNLSPNAIVSRATGELRGGDIILMHQGDMRSVRALPMILAKIRARGLVPGRLSDIGAGLTGRALPASAVAAHRAALRLTE
jgi:peptidoglycan/xylan/chitin deacetylase (PgdA/CDA1 family)